MPEALNLANLLSSFRVYRKLLEGCESQNSVPGASTRGCPAMRRFDAEGF